MSLQCGIVGLPNVGKSTLFNALTSSDIPAENYPFCTVDPNIGIVNIDDKRLNNIISFFNPKKIVKNTIEFVDIAGLVKGASKGEGLGNQFLSQIRQVETIIHVVRCFDNDNITHVEKSVDPIRDVELINTELLIKDIETIDKKLIKAQKDSRSGSKESKQRLDFFNSLSEHCNEGKTANLFHVPDEMNEEMKQLQLLSNKRILYVANVDEQEITNDNDNEYSKKLIHYSKSQGNDTIKLCCKLEQDLSVLDESEKREFLKEFNLKEIGLSKLISKAYQLLNLETFFTGGPEEVRAWTIKKGSTAPEAAGKIHTDFQRGFIKAETYHYSDMLNYNNELSLKEAGKIRVEGKNYIVKDGDIMFFKFNV